jgi:autotransporter-associated beta strand protein/T5SS/PEP-CTERM-associated repeat protein
MFYESFGVASSSRRRGAILALLAASSLPDAMAVDGTWINTDNATSLWSDTTNWLGGTVGDGIDSTISLVYFPTYNITGGTTDIGANVTLDGARTAGNILMEDLDNLGSASVSILNNGTVQTLTLQTTAGIPTVLVGQNLNGIVGGKKAILNTNIVAGTQGLRKTGPGYLGLRQANAASPHTFTGDLRIEGGLLQLASQTVYTGNTVVSGGATLFMDFANANAPATNPISNLSPLVLGSNGSGGITRGGSVIVNSFKAAPSAQSQTWASTTLNEGTHQFRLVSANTQDLTYTLGAVTRNAGATVDFSRSATAGNVVVNANIANGANGIIGGWAITSNTGNTTFDWAINNGANVIAPLATYAANTFGAGLHTNLTLPPLAAIPAGTTTNTLKINNNFSMDIGLAGSLTVETGGILVGQQSPGLSGGTLTTGESNGELILHSYGGGTGLRIGSTIANNGPTPLNLIKAGTGQVTLTANNTYTGTTYVGGGVLQIGNGWGGGATGSTGTGDIFLNGLSNGTGSYAPSGTLLFNRAGTLTVTNNLSGPGILAQAGIGTLVLNKQVNVRNLQGLAGTIRLDYSAPSAPANELFNSIESAGIGSMATGFLSLRGSKLEIIGKDGVANTQSFGLTTALGAARIQITPGLGGTVTLNLGALGRFHNNNDGGATLRIDMPATGVTVTAPNGGSPGQTQQNGIIVDLNAPWVTIGDNNWAGKDTTLYNAGTPTSSVKILPGSSIPGFYTLSSGGVFSGNLDVDNSPTIAAMSVLQSMRFNAAGANTVTINAGVQLEPHGILVGTGVGAANVTIAGPGTIRGTDDGGANARDLPIIQNNTAGELVITAPIVNFDADTRTTLVKSGLGTLTLSNGGSGTVTHTFTDRLLMNEGTLKVGAGTSLGTTAARIGSVLIRGGTVIVEGDGVINTGATNSFTSVGQRIGEDGTLTLRGNGSYDTSLDFNVGDVSARGTLNIQDNAQLRTKRFFIGKSGFAEGTVNLSGNGQILASNTPDTEWNLGGNGAGDPTAHGIVNQSGTSNVNFSNVNFQIGRNGIGDYNLSGGTVSGTGFHSVGRFVSGVGTLNISGTGSWNANPGGAGSNFFIVAESGTGTLNVSGTGLLTAKNLSIAHNGGVGTVNLNGGTIDLQNTAAIGAIQAGVVFGQNNAPGTPLPGYGGVLSLNGGTLRTFGIRENPGVTTPVSSRVNLNGGTIVAIGANGTFMEGLDDVRVQAGGAIFDTNGFDVTVAQPLVHDTALGLTPDGGMTKAGLGELQLTGASTYTGPTLVNAGALNVAAGGSIASNVTVGASGTLRGSGTIDGNVTVNGQFQPGTLTLVNDNLSLNSTSATTLEISGTTPGSFDRVTGISLLTLDGPISVTLNGGFNPANGDSFDFFDFSSINATAFNLATELTLPALNPGLSWNTSSFLTSGVLAVVPEPSSIVVLAGAIALLATRRTRRRQA